MPPVGMPLLPLEPDDWELLLELLFEEELEEDELEDDELLLLDGPPEDGIDAEGMED